MIPDRPGYYWVKHYGYDGSGGKSVSEWFIAEYVEGSWETIGDECGMDRGNVVEIGPEIMLPEGLE